MEVRSSFSVLVLALAAMRRGSLSYAEFAEMVRASSLMPNRMRLVDRGLIAPEKVFSYFEPESKFEDLAGEDPVDDSELEFEQERESVESGVSELESSSDDGSEYVPGVSTRKYLFGHLEEASGRLMVAYFGLSVESAGPKFSEVRDLLKRVDALRVSIG